ncbi:MAG: hypothetical protein O7D86_03085 [Proteobacteria bacterium]|nr:hypothetical protein [Pseudomonadota bacterium]
MNTGQHKEIVRDVPGTYHSPFSLKPLKDVKRFYHDLGNYVIEHKEKYNGASVFKCNPGVRAILVTDHKAAEFCFNAPVSLLQRANNYRIGPLRTILSQTGRPPAVASSGEAHKKSRGLVDAILRYRSSFCEAALEKALEQKIAYFQTQDSFCQYEECFFLMSKVAFDWLFEIELSDGDCNVAMTWVLSTFKPDSDNFLSKFILKNTVQKCTKKEKQAAQRLLAIVRSSKHYDHYIKLAVQQGIQEEIDKFLLSLCFINAAGAPFRTLFPALTYLSMNPHVVEKLKKELSGATVTQESIAQFPFLDCVFYEAFRFFT